jgi:hypothetical protein
VASSSLTLEHEYPEHYPEDQHHEKDRDGDEEQHLGVPRAPAAM